MTKKMTKEEERACYAGHNKGEANERKRQQEWIGQDWGSIAVAIAVMVLLPHLLFWLNDNPHQLPGWALIVALVAFGGAVFRGFIRPAVQKNGPTS